MLEITPTTLRQNGAGRAALEDDRNDRIFVQPFSRIKHLICFPVSVIAPGDRSGAIIFYGPHVRGPNPYCCSGHIEIDLILLIGTIQMILMFYINKL